MNKLTPPPLQLLASILSFFRGKKIGKEFPSSPASSVYSRGEKTIFRPIDNSHKFDIKFLEESQGRGRDRGIFLEGGEEGSPTHPIFCEEKKQWTKKVGITVVIKNIFFKRGFVSDLPRQ